MISSISCIINKNCSLKAASNNSSQSLHSNEQVPQQTGIEIEVSLDPDMLDPELFPSPVAGDPGSDTCMGLFYRVDVEALETWANSTIFMSWSLG